MIGYPGNIKGFFCKFLYKIKQNTFYFYTDFCRQGKMQKSTKNVLLRIWGKSVQQTYWKLEEVPITFIVNIEITNN